MFVSVTPTPVLVSARRWITMTTMMTTSTRTIDLEREIDVMEMLRLGIPLTLLLDLTDPFGPHSEEIYISERSADSAA
jgi:hypothetical protein